MYFPYTRFTLIIGAGAAMIVLAAPERFVRSLRGLERRAEQPQPEGVQKYMLTLARAPPQAGQATDYFSYQTGLRESDASCFKLTGINSNTLATDGMTMAAYPDTYDGCHIEFSDELTTSTNNPSRNWFNGHPEGHPAGKIVCLPKIGKDYEGGACTIHKPVDPAQAKGFCNSSCECPSSTVEIRCTWQK